MKHHNNAPPRLSRRGFLQVIAVTGAAKAALWQFGLRPGSRHLHTVRQSRIMMGTQINLTVHGTDLDACEDAVASTLGRMEKLTAMLSRHDPGSLLSRLNREGILIDPATDLQNVLHLANHVSRVTEGAFDITVLPLLKLYRQTTDADTLPSRQALQEALQLVDFRKIALGKNTIQLEKQGMSITLDGIGKGYIVDQGVATLQSKGFTNVYVEAGGDLMVKGIKPNKKTWRIGVRPPRPEKKETMLTLDVSNRAIATSGDYMQPYTLDRRHHHIIDPRTGISPPELASATVAAPTVAMADGLATAAMVLGSSRSLEILNSLPECEGLLIGKDLKQYRSKGFPA